MGKVTDAQVKELRRQLRGGSSLKKAAMKANMDRKSARKYREGKMPAERRQERRWRTRVDPLATVWPELQRELERAPELQANTLLALVQKRYPGQYGNELLRTMQRRVKCWRALSGPDKEVFFAQVHQPGRLGASDFTHLTSLGVTIAGQAFPHLAYHFVLTYSNWEHVTLCFSESFASLSEGYQNAVWALGGVPWWHRTDCMTLAVNQDGNPERFTKNYQALMEHYGVKAQATNPYSGHENGDCEQGHRQFKRALDQALLVRGSRDFATREEYTAFAEGVVARQNAGRQQRFVEELAQLRPLPAMRLQTLQQLRVKVASGSTIRVLKNTYSVPARLIGEVVEARIAAETIEVWYAGERVQQMERLRGQSHHRIDYRHVSAWLVRKPGAFARYVYREDLYPTLTYRRAYDALVAGQPGRADREYVRLLHLATEEGEAKVEAALGALLAAGQAPTALAVRAHWGEDTPWAVAARVAVPAVDLRAYDALLDGARPESDNGMSLMNREEEDGHEHGRDTGVGALPAGAVPAGDAGPVCRSGAAGSGGELGLPRLPARAGARGVPAAAAAPHRTIAEGVEAALGEELVGAGPEAAAGKGSAAVARALERRLPGAAGERAGIRPAGFGQDARGVCPGAGVGTDGPAGAVHDVCVAGAGPAGGQARPDAEGVAEAAGPVRGAGDRRPGVRAAEPGRDGGVVHAPGGALRARQRAGDEQPAVLEMGPDLQGPDDRGGGHRPAGAPQRDRGAERGKLPGRGSEEGEGPVGRVIVAGAPAECVMVAHADVQATPAKPAAGEPRPF